MSESSPASSNPAPWNQLLREVADRWPVDRWRGLGVVVGCSGGADSVALVSTLAALRRSTATAESVSPEGFLVVAHFNHRLRGTESDADQQLAWQLSQQQGLRWSVGHSETTQSDEASMRSERMRFLIETAHATGSRYVALAHSADDNVETVLHHLLRGTGPAGLCGMGSPREIAEDLVLVRPLLHTRRDLIRSALATEGIPWREDASNLDPAYRRNWIRHQLIPLIQSKYPHASQAIERAIEGQRQWRRTIDHLAERWLEDHWLGDHPVALRRDRETDPGIAIAAAQRLWARFDWPRGEMTQGHWLRLAETLRGDEVERYALPSGVDVIADDRAVKLRREVEG